MKNKSILAFPGNEQPAQSRDEPATVIILPVIRVDPERSFKRDRFGHNNACGVERQALSRIIYMAHAKGYVMCRRPRCTPFVLPEKLWLSFPLWEG